MTNGEDLSGLCRIEGVGIPAGFNHNTWPVSMAIDPDSNPVMNARPAARSATFVSGAEEGGHVQRLATFLRSVEGRNDYHLHLRSSPADQEAPTAALAGFVSGPPPVHGAAQPSQDRALMTP